MNTEAQGHLGLQNALQGTLVLSILIGVLLYLIFDPWEFVAFFQIHLFPDFI